MVITWSIFKYWGVIWSKTVDLLFIFETTGRRVSFNAHLNNVECIYAHYNSSFAGECDLYFGVSHAIVCVV